MIRLVASTILERPMLIRSGTKSTMEQHVKQHIYELPNMMKWFRNAIVSVSRWSKWGKLVLLRNNVPVEIFDLVKPFLICRGKKDFYPNVSCDQWVPRRKYLLLEAKLYRLEIVCDKTHHFIRHFIADNYEFREESKTHNWQLRQFKQLDKRLDFIERILIMRYLETDEGIRDTIYNIELMLRYWF